jgi:hypothetical protein
MRYHCSNSWLFEKQNYVKMKYRVLRIYVCIVNAFLWWDAIDRTVDCLFEKQNYIKMKHRVLRRKFYLKTYSFIGITSDYDTFELSFLRHVFPFVSFFTTCFHLSLFSPGVCLCLFFHQVFVFVSFFALCLPLCFWFTIFFYHILTSNAFHVTHGCNARVLSPRRSL